MVWWTRFSPPAVTSSPKSPNRKRDAQYHSPERTPLLFLRQNRNAGEPARLRAGRRAHLRRVHRHLQRNDGPERHRAGPRRRTPAHPAGNQGPPRRIRHRAGRGQKDPRRGGAQPLQARLLRRRPQGRRRCGARKEQHPACRPLRERQDAPRQDAGPRPARAVRHRGRHHADRGRVCGRRRGKHSGPVASKCRLRP